MSDRVAVMRGGRDRAVRRRRASSTRQPATAFVANFLGASNLIPVEVAAQAAAPTHARPVLAARERRRRRTARRWR